MKIKDDDVEKEDGETLEKNGDEPHVEIEEPHVEIEEPMVDTEDSIDENEEPMANQIESTDAIEEPMVNVDEARGEEVERLVNDEYKYWKSQMPFLYDLVISHAIEWPSLTVEWLPHRIQSPDGPYSVQKVILGTRTTEDESNYITIAQVKLPLLEEDESDEEDGTGCEDDPESPPGHKIEISQQIHHDGGVNRARHFPQDPFIIATRTLSSEVHIFDCRNHPAKPPINGKSNPDLRLMGQGREGYGLSWSIITRGYLLSEFEDGTVCLWDINQAPSNHAMAPLRTFYHMYGGYAADVAWHSKHSYLFASSGGHILRMFDLRSPAPIASRSGIAHRSEINCVSFNPFNESLVASGSDDTTVMLFDMRSLDHPIHTFNYHSEGVLQIGWSPHNGNILASSCADRRIMVWDTSRIGMRQSAKDAEDGPAELLFIHGGHTEIVPDFSWNPTEEWLIASVSSDNMLQVWQMGDHVYND